METAPRQPLRELPFPIPRDNIDSGADLDYFNPDDINSTTADNQLELDFVNNDYCPQYVYTLDIVYEPIFEDSLSNSSWKHSESDIFVDDIDFIGDITPDNSEIGTNDTSNPAHDLNDFENSIADSESFSLDCNFEQSGTEEEQPALRSPSLLGEYILVNQ